MSIRIAINGFGRIGRLVLRALVESDQYDLEIVAINDLADADRLAHLLKYDSVHGRFPGTIEKGENYISVNGQDIPVFSERDPEVLPWSKLRVDIVLECTGFFLTQDLSGKHILAGAKRVLISAPAKDETKTIVYGVNHTEITRDDHIISNASCTTNALAPLIDTLHKTYGIKSGFMTTIHAYTGDQRLLDASHRDPYRSRAAAISMIPTTTGAAKAIGKVIPDMQGRLDGTAVRVPLPNVSAIDLTVLTERPANVGDVTEKFSIASKDSYSGVLGFVDEKLVSSDMNHDAHSSSFVADQTYVNDNHLVRVFAWYDNEWGFSNRMLDTATEMAKFLESE
ncbi:MAG: type I glyceraldehyde-3-phosphate dehydrogenase [Acidimicrobiales bacterium]|nr:type I glyceraldehyde-3-phosphate dehydrogenase [Hyphomonadaceae bacterium]RZV40108.1 MAG: type I glyceraldehyde-3-phosphate dehydrogenase [Acidimicrobiales bacterium]